MGNAFGILSGVVAANARMFFGGECANGLGAKIARMGNAFGILSGVVAANARMETPAALWGREVATKKKTQRAGVFF